MRKSVLVILFVLAGCSFWLSAGATEPPVLAKLSGAEKVRVAKLIEEAKKEGPSKAQGKGYQEIKQ